jgi:MoxR-like ATPase
MTQVATEDAARAEALVEGFVRDVKRLRAEIGTVIVGNEPIVAGVISCLLAGGHGLLEGVPGLGKTMLVRTLAQTLDLHFSRIQFTPDLMPADILGTNVIVEGSGGKHFEFQRGPVFAHIVLADEINRATPKTQSALLEAMQEMSVTVSKTTYKLEPPFLVLATQNPLEMEGTYPLPEAQLDRFLYKLKLGFPDRESLHTILERTTSVESPEAHAVVTRQRILEMREVVRQVPVPRAVQDYAIRMVLATHPNQPGGPKQGTPEITAKYVRYGASPRAAQALLLGAKILSLLDGRFSASCDDIRAVAAAALRHRIILNFEGEAEGVTTDRVIEEILAKLPEAAS